MEHSLLHALQLAGAVVTLGGAILVLGFLLPALRVHWGDEADSPHPGPLPDERGKRRQGIGEWTAHGKPADVVDGDDEPGGSKIKRKIKIKSLVHEERGRSAVVDRDHESPRSEALPEERGNRRQGVGELMVHGKPADVVDGDDEQGGIKIKRKIKSLVHGDPGRSADVDEDHEPPRADALPRERRNRRPAVCECAVAGKEEGKPALAQRIESGVAKWAFFGAALGALAAALNILVDVAETEGRTVFGGVHAATVWRFAAMTTVGRISVLRIATLIFAGVAARFRGGFKWWMVLAGALAGAVCESLICHAAAQPAGRLWAVGMELTHLLAVSSWMGVLINLLLVRRVLESSSDDQGMMLVALLIKRFSPFALAGAGLLALSGLVLAVRYLGSPAAVVTSAYGLTLLVKLGLMGPLLYAAYFNYRIIRPQLQTARSGTDEGRRALLRRFTRALELEVTAGVLVIAAAGILASVSPPQEWSALRLTAAQTSALLTPHLPRTNIANPDSFYGAPERTQADLFYAEFMHNWSGLVVLLLGLCWLAQSLGGSSGRRAAEAWPWLLVPFPFFIAVASDPEVWLLRRVTFAETIREPQLLEHQLGALLALLIVALGWLDRRRPEAKRPLGYTLPVLMILGSLMLLGHAHSNFSNTQEVTNLINIQHAVFGAFGLFAGVVRWLSLRELFPARAARVIWPSLVICLGLFMAFCYRETV